ncbi:MAG: Txe/YoeB family addiction module toxin [Firmicutes bacterium]|nr:Txe/YoeB family addiction module toxin [Bacillota bacterium]
MGRISFSEKAWEDYLYWQSQDKKTLRRINLLLQDISRNGFTGIGKPEPLKENLTGLWSRRIDDTNRLVYRISGDLIEVVQCRGHYDD